MIWKMLKNRKRISEGDSPDPGKLLDHIVLLGIDEYSLKRLCDADLLTIKDVVDCKDLLGISGMDEKHKKEVIIKIVDYLVN